MKIYAIKYSFDNGEYYDMNLCGDGIINYYATKELAIEEFNKIDPQSILDNYTDWMRFNKIDDYSLEKKINNGLPEYYYENIHNVSCFNYEIVEVDVIENCH